MTMPFRDAWGEPAQRFDLGQPNLPAEFVAPYAEAFRGIMHRRHLARVTNAGKH
ncbi:hypothetical protein ACQ5SK_27605 [Bradyrhizobium japonicum]